ncbi:MAG TPA: hypothetical protein VK155_07875 [Bacteroidales bacterium]|jgi:hypothetical protein|nr:hypothetical protein [Bacteroidales bacterium]
MPRARKILKIFFILLLVAVASSCASSRKNTYYQKRKKASHVNTEQLGRNRYFFSNGYQKKLNSTYKRKR